MRHVSVLAILASSISLAACGGGGGSSLSSAMQSASVLGVCGVSGTGPGCTTSSSSGGASSGGASSGGASSGGASSGGSSGAGTGGLNTGNTTGLASGDTTLIIENSKLANTPPTTGLSSLTFDVPNSTAKIQIDTKTANNGLWPVAKDLELYASGVGAGGSAYQEYRILKNDGNSTTKLDEELQYWNWGQSYSTQYRHTTSGGEAAHQAWSFGGTRTAAAAMPTAGIVNYNSGAYVATAKTEAFAGKTGADINPNSLWRVTGTATGSANFGTSAFTATLVPTTWNGYSTATNDFRDVVATNVGDASWVGFMDDSVVLKGTISTNTSLVPGTNPNAIVGTARILNTSGAVTNTSVNPMYAAFFGATANEVTGAFNLEATYPSPSGGSTSINDDRRAYIYLSGTFNLK